MGHIAMCVLSAATASGFFPGVLLSHFIMAVYHPPNSVMYVLLLPEVWGYKRTFHVRCLVASFDAADCSQLSDRWRLWLRGHRWAVTWSRRRRSTSVFE